MTALKTARLLNAHRRQISTRDSDSYTGVEVPNVLSYLKNEPVVVARLTDDGALLLAQQLIAAVRRERAA